MTLFQIYFIIAGAILLIKFLYDICTFNRLKIFVDEYRCSIDELIEDQSLSYSDLVIYHFSTNSVKYSKYKEEMKAFMARGTSAADLAIYFLFALFWVISIPCVLFCLLYGWLGTLFEKFSKSILS